MTSEDGGGVGELEQKAVEDPGERRRQQNRANISGQVIRVRMRLQDTQREIDRDTVYAFYC
jgi:hypothetical protein